MTSKTHHTKPAADAAACDRADATSRNEHIGIVFKPRALYAPLPNQATQRAHVETLLEEIDPADFDIALNSSPGEVVGIHLGIGQGAKIGTVFVDRSFAENYTGPWPANLEVRYLKNGRPVDLGVLQLRDGRNVVPTHMRTEVRPLTVQVPVPNEEKTVFALAFLFDADWIELPFERDNWEFHLDSPRPGLVLNDNQLLIQHGVEPGPVQLRITAMGGLEERITVDIVPIALP